MRTVFFSSLLALSLASTGMAQDATDDADQGGMLVSVLENMLSSENQSIRVIGLEGALSARARLQELQVLDKDGAWLTLRGAVLDWNRLALVRGRFSVNELTADEIIVTRAPLPSDTPDLPDPEAAAEPFSIPELPVAVIIDKLSIGKIELGEALLGQQAVLDLDGALNLADGALMAQLTSDRLDRPGDGVTLDLQASNETRNISIDLDFNEAPGGLIGTVLDLPDAPALELTVNGSGTYDDLITDIALKANDTPQLAGTVTLAARDSETPGTIFTADIGGDLRPLLEDTIDPFFGPDTRLTLAGLTAPDGNIEIEEFRLDAQALKLDGRVSLTGGTVNTVSLDGQITQDGTAPIILPVAGGEHSVKDVTLTLRADGGEERWSLGAAVDTLAIPGTVLDSARLVSGGSFVQGDTASLAGDIRVDVDGLSLADQALAQAVGSVIRLSGSLGWTRDDGLRLQDVALEGAGYLANLDAQLQGIGGNGQLDATADLSAGNLAQFSDLAGMDLSGVADARAQISAELLTGSFDAQADAKVSNLTTGIAELDPLLTGETTLTVNAARGTDGITLREMTLNGEALTAQASGQLQSVAAKLDVTAKLDDLARIEPALPGPVTLTADVTRSDGGPWSAVASLAAPKGAGGEITAQYDGTNADAKIQLGAIDLGSLVPPEFLPFDVNGTASLADGDLKADLDLTSGASIRAKLDASMVDGTGKGTLNATVDALADLPADLFPMTLSGKGHMNAGVANGQVDLAAAEFAKLKATAKLAADGAFDLKLAGDAQAVEALFPPELAPVTLTASADRATDGLWAIVADIRAAQIGTLDLDGSYQEGGAGHADLTAGISAVDGLIPPGIAPIALTGRADLSDSQTVDTRIALKAAQDGLDMTVTAQHDGIDQGQIDIQGIIKALGELLPPQVLPIELTANGALEGAAAKASADVTAGALGILSMTGTRSADGLAHADLTGQIRKTGLAEVDGLLPLDLTGTANQDPDGRLRSDLRLKGPSASYLDITGDRAPDTGTIAITFDALLDEMQRVVPQISGQLTAKGSAIGDGPLWTVGLDVAGPSNITATANGTYNTDAQTADVKGQGNLQLSGLNPIIRSNEIDGTLGFDLALTGAPSLDNLSGTVTVQNSSLDVPGFEQRIVPINVTVSMDQGSANLNARLGLDAGGATVITGPVDLTAPYPANLNIDLQQLILTDNLSVRSGASGNLRFNGNILGNSQLAGTVRIAPTRINLANLGGSVSAAPIPEIRHVNESSASYLTREHAGLIASEESGTPPNVALDIAIEALDGVEVTGMGLDANLGGTIEVNGTLANIRPSGAIELDTGTFVILGRPLRLTDGRVSLQDNLDPYIRFAASSLNSEGSATIAVEGPLDQPEVTVTSVPERPPEEALALLLFGNRQSQISPIKIAQIAAQFATGGGVLFGGDVEEDDSARGRIRNPAEHIYTDFVVNSEGQNEVVINLDVTDKITLRGTVDNAGDTALGMFFQRDY